MSNRFDVYDRVFEYVQNDDSVRGIVGNNREYYLRCDNKKILSELEPLLRALNNTDTLDTNGYLERTVVTEWGEEAKVSVQADVGRWSVAVNVGEENIAAVSFNVGNTLEVITDPYADIDAYRLVAFYLSVLVYDESEATYFAEMASRLSMRWNCSHIMPDYHSVRDFLCVDMVRIKREKLAERVSCLTSLLELIERNELDHSEEMRRSLLSTYKTPGLLEERRCYLSDIEKTIVGREHDLDPTVYEEVLRFCRMVKIELRVTCVCEAERNWEIGYALINVMLAKGTDYTSAAVELLQSADIRGATKMLNAAARTQDISAQIMEFVGDVSTEEYNSIIRFKRGGSGGTDNDAHKRLRGMVNRCNKLIQNYIEDRACELGLSEIGQSKLNLGRITVLLMSNREFNGVNADRMFAISGDEMRVYSEIYSSDQILAELISSAMAFKDAHVRVFECHHHICSKVVSTDKPSLLGNSVNELKSRIFPAVSLLEFWRHMGQKGAAHDSGVTFETAILSGGCFWILEDALSQVAGVHGTKTGYTGGDTEFPTYADICANRGGHVEAVHVVFDPEVLSYGELLEIYWGLHDPTSLLQQGSEYGPQYRALVFTSGERQREIAGTFMKRMASSMPKGVHITTEVTDAVTFWPAEAEHQKTLYKRRVSDNRMASELNEIEIEADCCVDNDSGDENAIA